MKSRCNMIPYGLEDKKGFTLLELILVMFVAGLAVSVSVVSVSRLYEKSIYKEEAKKVFRVLKQGRDISLLNRTVIALKTDSGAGTYWLESNGNPAGAVHTLPKGIAMKADNIVFFPKGNSTGGSVELSGASKNSFLIEVDPVTGTAKVKGL